jgi:hypothetical protein
VRIQIATDPGSTDQANEDAAAFADGFLAVADGATSRTETGCVHAVAWYARHLVDAAVCHAQATPADALALAVRDTAGAHADTCDLASVATPNAAVVIVQADGNVVRFLALGDVAVIVESTAGINVVVDDRVSRTALAERAMADALAAGSPEKTAALVTMKRAELAARNVEGGYWVAAADPKVVDHALVWSVPRSEIRRAAVLSDGAARIVDPFGALDWSGTLDLLAAEGPAELIRKVREIEATDPAGENWPRNKISDDATAAFIDFG